MNQTVPREDPFEGHRMPLAAPLLKTAVGTGHTGQPNSLTAQERLEDAALVPPVDGQGEDLPPPLQLRIHRRLSVPEARRNKPEMIVDAHCRQAVPHPGKLGRSAAGSILTRQAQRVLDSPGGRCGRHQPHCHVNIARSKRRSARSSGRISQYSAPASPHIMPAASSLSN